MADKFDKKTRSRVMADVKNKNTQPELNIRKALFAKGLRYRIHNKKLPGCPDIVFPKYKAVIFIHGCFWHNHDCKQGQLRELLVIKMTSILLLLMITRRPENIFLFRCHSIIHRR